MTFDVGPMPAPPTAATLHAAARAYMRQLLRVDPHFWIARRFLELKTRGTMQGHRLRIEDGQSSFEIGADDSEPGRLLIVYAAVL